MRDVGDLSREQKYFGLSMMRSIFIESLLHTFRMLVGGRFRRWKAWSEIASAVRICSVTDDDGKLDWHKPQFLEFSLYALTIIDLHG